MQAVEAAHGTPPPSRAVRAISSSCRTATSIARTSGSVHSRLSRSGRPGDHRVERIRHAVRVGILIRIVLNAVAVWIATLLVGGIEVTAATTGGEILTLLAVGALFGVVNAIIKPIALLLSLPLIILTLGLFVLVVNALLFWLIGAISDGLGVPFEVDGFWAAFWGAIVVSLVSWLLSIVVKDRDD